MRQVEACARDALQKRAAEEADRKRAMHKLTQRQIQEGYLVRERDAGTRDVSCLVLCVGLFHVGRLVVWRVVVCS